MGGQKGFPGIILGYGGVRFIHSHLRITDNDGQRCAQLMCDGLHDPVTVGDKLLVRLDRLLQFYHMFFQLLPVGCFLLDVPVDFQVGEDEQENG